VQPIASNIFKIEVNCPKQKILIAVPFLSLILLWTLIWVAFHMDLSSLMIRGGFMENLREEF